MICVKFISAVRAYWHFKLMKRRAETALLCFENLRCHVADTGFTLINYFKGGLTVYYSVFGCWSSFWCGSVRPWWYDVKNIDPADQWIRESIFLRSRSTPTFAVLPIATGKRHYVLFSHCPVAWYSQRKCNRQTTQAPQTLHVLEGQPIWKRVLRHMTVQQQCLRHVKGTLGY